jgi:hypothetical protein
MPRYLVERTVGQLTEEEWEATGRKANEAVGALGGVVWVRSYISHAEGKVYCEYEAPSREAVIELSRLAGMPIDLISEISLEISPTMFM